MVELSDLKLINEAAFDSKKAAKFDKKFQKLPGPVKALAAIGIGIVGIVSLPVVALVCLGSCAGFIKKPYIAKFEAAYKVYNKYKSGQNIDVAELVYNSWSLAYFDYDLDKLKNMFVKDNGSAVALLQRELKRWTSSPEGQEDLKYDKSYYNSIVESLKYVESANLAKTKVSNTSMYYNIDKDQYFLIVFTGDCVYIDELGSMSAMYSASKAALKKAKSKLSWKQQEKAFLEKHPKAVNALRK